MRHNQAVAAWPQMQSGQLDQRFAIRSGGQNEFHVTPFQKFLMIFSALAVLQLPAHGRKGAIRADDPLRTCLYGLAGRVELELP